MFILLILYLLIHYYNSYSTCPLPFFPSMLYIYFMLQGELWNIKIFITLRTAKGKEKQQDSLFLSQHCQIDRLEMTKIFILLGNGFQLKGIWPGVRLYFSQPTEWYLERTVSRSLAEKCEWKFKCLVAEKAGGGQIGLKIKAKFCKNVKCHFQNKTSEEGINWGSLNNSWPIWLKVILKTVGTVSWDISLRHFY